MMSIINRDDVDDLHVKTKFIVKTSFIRDIDIDIDINIDIEI
jgi:hypothetical protein